MTTTTGEALLVLEDGTAFRGRSFGAAGTVTGEAVFNTGMSGYQEVLTDPSYRGQLVAMTAPMVGNYGMNAADAESDRIQVAGYVVREAARRPSSWRSEQGLREALDEADVPGIEGIDTRRLTRHLREAGAMRAALSTEVLDVDELVRTAEASPGMVGRDLASEVTTTRPYDAPAPPGSVRFRIVAIDFGIKRNILRMLNARGVSVKVLPASATPDEVLQHDPDGVFLSPGPGDPAAVTQGIATTAALLGERPVFGICLGSQLLGRALGAGTTKLRFGHRGANQPVLRRRDGAVEITSHNHGFAVRAETLGNEVRTMLYDTADHGRVEVSHYNLNDGVVEGLRCHDLAAFTVQYHPEAAPGPHDATYLFDDFTEMMSNHGRGA
jgi:carbamoyl-phosphate synthase small subunit